MHNPSRLNAFGGDQEQVMMDAINKAQDDDNVKVILIHGGSYFSAGNDLTAMAKGMGQEKAQEKLDYALNVVMVGFLMSLAKSVKPIVMLVRGGGIGIGFTMVAHSTFAYCSPEAKFMTPFMKSS